MPTSFQTPRLPRALNAGLVVALAVLLSGCWAASIKPSAAEIGRLATILVVPVEAPPLEIIPDPVEQRIPAYGHYRNMAMDFTLPQKLYRTKGGVTVAGLVSAPDDEQELAILDASARPSLSTAADTEQGWTPTLVLARQAITQLTGNRINAVLSPAYYRLPIADADRDAQLAHWRDALTAWYGQDSAATDYRNQAGIDAVLELGFGNYRIFAGQTTVQVLMKLVDPHARRVIARTRAATVETDAAGTLPLDRDSEPFKQLVEKMSQDLLKQGFNDMGWRLQGGGQT